MDTNQKEPEADIMSIMMKFHILFMQWKSQKTAMKQHDVKEAMP